MPHGLTEDHRLDARNKATLAPAISPTEYFFMAFPPS